MASRHTSNPISAERRKANELFAQGLGYKAAAKQLGVYEGTVRDWKREWVRKNTPPEERFQDLPWRQKAAEAFYLHAQGVSMREICIRFGVSREAVFSWKRRLKARGEYDETALKRPSNPADPVQESLFD